jgi:hypothetical protein
LAFGFFLFHFVASALNDFFKEERAAALSAVNLAIAASLASRAASDATLAAAALSVSTLTAAASAASEAALHLQVP